MRALIISVISLGLLIGFWGIYYHYSEQLLHQFITNCEQDIMPAIENEDWDNAYDLFTHQYSQWRTYQKKASYMLESDYLNKVNESYAKTQMYIKAKDLSNSSGELFALQHQLESLHKNESLVWSNVF